MPPQCGGVTAVCALMIRPRAAHAHWTRVSQVGEARNPCAKRAMTAGRPGRTVVIQICKP